MNKKTKKLIQQVSIFLATIIAFSITAFIVVFGVF